MQRLEELDEPVCPGPKPPFWAVKRPARPYKNAIQPRCAVENANTRLTAPRGRGPTCTGSEAMFEQTTITRMNMCALMTSSLPSGSAAGAGAPGAASPAAAGMGHAATAAAARCCIIYICSGVAIRRSFSNHAAAHMVCRPCSAFASLRASAVALSASRLSVVMHPSVSRDWRQRGHRCCCLLRSATARCADI